jgi:histidine triad (HIT) family protein
MSEQNSPDNSANEPSIFTRILLGEIPAEILFEDDQCFVISDIAPQAPTHLLLIPKQEIPRLVDTDEAHQSLLGHLMLVVGKMAKKFGIDDAFRLVINNGEGAGQTVFHLHMHIMGNKKFNEADLQD